MDASGRHSNFTYSLQSGKWSGVSEWSAEWQGKLLRVKFSGQKRRRPLPKKRGVIKGFTDGSRRRMLQLAATIDWKSIGPALFITLTYPDDKAEFDMRERNKQRYLFVRHMENYLDATPSIIWRIEWKPRKTGSRIGEYLPHVHLLVLGVRFIPHGCVRSWWRSILKHRGSLSTDVRAVRSGKAAALYVSKYCAKRPERASLDNLSYLNSLGRHWGIHRRSAIKTHPAISIPYLTEEMLQIARNAGCMAIPWFDASSDAGFFLLGDLAERVGQILLKMDVDKWQRNA